MSISNREEAQAVITDLEDAVIAKNAADPSFNISKAQSVVSSLANVMRQMYGRPIVEKSTGTGGSGYAE